MTKKEIIDGLKFTVDLFLFNPSTGEKLTEPRNDMDKTTIDACKGAIELLEQKPSREIEDYENEIEDLHNRLDIAEGDKECYKKEIEELETEICALKNEQSQVEKQVKDLDEAGKWFLEGVIEGFNEQTEMDDLIIENMQSAEKTTLSAEKTTITDGDLISRQAVINAMYELCETGETLKENPWRDNPHIDALVETVEEIPSAENTAEMEIRNIFDILTEHKAMLNDIKMMLPSAEKQQKK